VASYTLTLARAQAYAERFDLRTAIVRAARQILDGYGLTAAIPGSGNTNVPRSFTSVDFQKGAATGRKLPVALGDRRYFEYAEFYGTLTVMNSVPIETDAETEGAYLTAEHLRELDRLCSLEDAIFMEHVEPFTAALLPLHDVIEIIPIEPDERPEEEREINTAFRRWRIKVAIRSDAWPTE
jgi:hypothetical protein